MPPKRQSEGAQKEPKSPKKAREPKENKSGSPPGERAKTGAWTVEEEKTFLLSVLILTEFRMTKEIREKLSKRLGRNEDPIHNFWYQKLSRQLRELENSQADKGGTED